MTSDTAVCVCPVAIHVSCTLTEIGMGLWVCTRIRRWVQGTDHSVLDCNVFRRKSTIPPISADEYSARGEASDGSWRPHATRRTAALPLMYRGPCKAVWPYGRKVVQSCDRTAERSHGLCCCPVFVECALQRSNSGKKTLFSANAGSRLVSQMGL